MIALEGYSWAVSASSFVLYRGIMPLMHEFHINGRALREKCGCSFAEIFQLLFLQQVIFILEELIFKIFVKGTSRLVVCAGWRAIIGLLQFELVRRVQIKGQGSSYRGLVEHFL